MFKIPPPNYTQTPNDLFDHWLPHLGEAELKVLLVIMRKTFGWHKTHDVISSSQLAKHTGMTEESVIKAARSLQGKGVITRDVIGPIGKQQTIYALVVEQYSNNSYPSVESRGPLGLDPPDQTEAQKKPLLKENIQKKQQQSDAHAQEEKKTAAVFSEPVKYEVKKPEIWPMLEKVEIPTYDKKEITKFYSQEDTEHGVMWLATNTKVLKVGAAAALKWACKTKPEIEKPKKAEKEKPPTDPSCFNKAYYRQIAKFAYDKGVNFRKERLIDDGPVDHIKTEHEKIFYKDVSFLEQLACFLRKKGIKCLDLFDTITKCQCDLGRQL